jgi:hypothetical protein
VSAGTGWVFGHGVGAIVVAYRNLCVHILLCVAITFSFVSRVDVSFVLIFSELCCYFDAVGISV